MVSAAGLRDLALVPVRGTVYVVKLPFLFVWMALAYVCAFLYSIVARIVSVPVSYMKRAARRIQLTWNWTKSSARAVLPWKPNTEPCQLSAIRRQELEDYQYDSELQYELSRTLRHRHGRKSRRKAIISSLIKILLDPVSPAESEEETEIVEETEDDKVYKLIRDLVQFSKSWPRSSRQALRGCSGQGLDIETLRQHAKDKEKLQDLICELDQYVKDMDEGHGTGGDVLPQGRLEMQYEMVTPDPDTDTYMDASGGEAEMEASGDKSGEEYEEFDDAHSSLHVDMTSCLQGRELSPVAEVSPEAVSTGSTESLDRNCEDLESELNMALSRLSNLTNELTEDMEESFLESTQTKFTETVTFTAVTQGEGGSRKSSSERSETSYEDAQDDFPNIPKTSPILGLEAGHSKRNLATARKARPPSLPRGNQWPPDGVGDKGGEICREKSKEFEDGHSSDEECRGSEDHIVKKGAVQVLPPSLSDQFQLLTPSSTHQEAANSTPTHQPQATTDLYSTVNKKAARSKSEGEGGENTHPESDRHRSQSDSLPNGAGSSEKEVPVKSLFMHDLTPPWKQMRSHNSSSSNCSSDSSHVTPSHTLEQPATPPPPLPPRSTPPTQSHPPQADTPHPNIQDHQMESPDLYDRLPSFFPPPSIPSKAGEEGVYDIIPSHKQYRYLHEKMAASEKSKEQAHSTPPPPVSWTPLLPPRNGTSKLKRTCSAEVMGTLVKDHDRRGLTRQGSERRSSASATPESRERSHSSSSAKRVHSSTERDREKRIRRDHSSSDHHHRHHSRSSDSEKHRSSSEKKHRSYDKKSSPPSSKSKGGSEGSIVWRILSSTASSKSKSNESSHKRGKEEKEGRKEEGREKDKERKHSSSRSKEGSSSSSSRTHRNSSQKKEEQESMPRNESSSSLRSGVSMHSTDSSGKESLV